MNPTRGSLAIFGCDIMTTKRQYKKNRVSSIPNLTITPKCKHAIPMDLLKVMSKKYKQTVLMLLLTQYKTELGNCFTSHSINKLFNWHKNTLQRHLQWLEHMGLIHRDRSRSPVIFIFTRF